MTSQPKFKVTAYLSECATHSFDARDMAHAREIAYRIINEGLWVIKDATRGYEEWYPTHRVWKVKVAPYER